MYQPKFPLTFPNSPRVINNELIFSSKNPVISSHRVNDQFILPGLAYVDILFQFLRKQGHDFDQSQIKNLVIHNPLTIPEGSKVAAAITFSEIDNNKLKVRIDGRMMNNLMSSSDSLLYVTAEVWLKDVLFSDSQLDFQNLKRLKRDTYPIADVYNKYQTMGLVHDGFMKAEGLIYEADNHLLFEASLGEKAVPTARQFICHPVLLDSSVVATMRLFGDLVKKGNLFLPLHFESFSCSSEMNDRCFAFVPLSSVRQNQETVSLSIHYFDDRGKKIGELVNFTTKMVRPRTTGVPGKQSRLPVSVLDHANGDEHAGQISIFLKHLISETLNVAVDDIDVRTGYYEMGLDSARLLELVDKINSKIGIDLPPTLLFEYSNLSLLTDYLSHAYADRFEFATASPKKNDASKPYLATVPASLINTKHDKKHVNGKAGADSKTNSDVAIIGMAGRYPDARNLEEFWENLASGKDSINKVPTARWNPALYNHIKSPSGKDISQWGGFIDDPGHFDPMFFKISAREAEAMDPQERLFLEICWQAIEDAGYTPDGLGGGRRMVGVFAGVMHKDYALIANEAVLNGNVLPFAINNSSIANRVSYLCDFHGPSMVIDTACSSSLVAVHQAVQSILSGESEVTIAGGVNLSLHPAKYLSYGMLDMHSSDGRCKAFGKGGNGYVSSEGVGAVVLKSLRKAIEDGDQIYSVIKGSSINHVGSVSGMTVPSPVGQAAVIKDCLEKTGIDPRTIGCLEAHGTGTSLGDPIEIQGLIKAFSAYTDDKQFCSLGSVKSNIGHAEAAAGISGLTKLVLQFKHKTLVPSLHAEESNPFINLNDSPFVVQRKVEPWKGIEIEKGGIKTTYPCRAGISSFGASGTNAHVIMEAYDRAEEKPPVRKNKDVFLLPVSARSKDQLGEGVGNLLKFARRVMSTGANVNLIDVAYTLQVGRVEMSERVIFIADGLASWLKQLEQYVNGDEVSNCFVNSLKNHNPRSEDAINLLDVIAQDANPYDSFVKVSDAWVRGAKVNWDALYPALYDWKPRRVSLPTYPFSKEFYWIRSQPTTVNPPHITEKNLESSDKGQAKQRKIETPSPGLVSVEDLDIDLPLEKLTFKLKTLFSAVVKFSVDLIDEKEPLENYGIDSIMIVELNRSLASVYGELPSTLFYEYQTLNDLSQYLARDHKERSMDWIGLNAKVNDQFRNKTEATGFSTPATQSLMIGNSFASRDGSSGPRIHVQQPIAIIGINGRYTGAENLKDFWNNLKTGKDGISEIPDDRWDVSSFYHSDSSEAASLGKSYGKWGSFLESFADFDPQFFNISPKEARGMDPHIRLFLESCWKVLEDGGYTKHRLAELYNGNVGVFAGVTRSGYSYYARDLMRNGLYQLNTMSAVANRVSYLFNLKGPSMPIDTMCSSSLTAIHEACESLSSGKCKMAIAGGVNLLLHPSEYVMLSANNFLSTDGRCRSFGAGGDGYVPGEGVGTVLLKPLSEAIEDRDHIYAVIKSTSVNHGGKTNGYTVPNPVAQRELIRSALDLAGINARDVSYIEAHGTGTPLGDPIEVTGLTQAFRMDTPDTAYCAIGSLKSNIGHLEAAAGIAGLTKIVLQMQHKMLVPSLHSNELNPNINFEKTPFYVQQTLSEWKRPVREEEGKKVEFPRIAGISSFGAGGSNAHILLEEYKPVNESHFPVQPTAQPLDGNTFVILLSAKNEERLRVYAKDIVNELREGGYQDHQLIDVAYTLQVGREAMDERLALEAGSIAELVDKLENFINGGQDHFLGRVKDHKETISLLSADNEMAATVARWIANRNYAKLIGLWVKGLSIDWEQLYNDRSKPRRISLPTYPFDRKKYWVTDTGIKVTRVDALEGEIQKPISGEHKPVESVQKVKLNGEPSKNEEPYKLMFFDEVLEERSIDSPGSISSSSDTPPKNLVFFVSQTDNQAAVLSTMDQIGRGTKVIFVTLAREKADQPESYFINEKHDPESYSSVFNAIVKDNGEIDGMVYLWPLEDRSFIQDYEALVALFKAIASGRVKAKQVILAGEWKKQTGPFISDLDRCYLESWIGFERSLKLVMPGLTVKPVYQESSVQSDNLDLKKWISDIWSEIHNTRSQPSLYKDGKRYVYRIKPSPNLPGENAFKKGGTYLITGGLGNLGLLVARYLASRVSANLILIGRSAVVPEKREELEALRMFGADVIYVQADICSETDMREKLKNVKARVGTINGVVHAAGIIGADTLLNKRLENFRKVLDPKVDGTILLDDLLKDEPLDFVCYFTSSSAILGDFGSCDYSIASRFQMSFAHYRNELMKSGLRQGKAIAINWPLWKDGGMDLNEEESTKMYLKSSGQRYLTTDEGLAIFEQLISQEASQKLVFAGQENKVIRFLEQLEPERQSTSRHAVSEPAVKIRKASRKGITIDEYLEQDLTNLVGQAQQIPIETLLVDENLADLGFDSISLTELARALSKYFSIDVVPAVFFGYSTIEKLKEYFLKEHRTAIEYFYGRTDEDSNPAIETFAGEIHAVPMDVDPVTVTAEPATSFTPYTEPIAIIGMSGKFPEARNIDEMWRILVEGRDVVTEIPIDRFDWKKYYTSDGPAEGKTNCKWSGLVPGIAEFDAKFFEITPREAELMDPRQRLLLQEAWKALEDAGYGPSHLKENKVGLYVGVEEGSYDTFSKQTGLTSNHNALLAARLSYFLNLSGPNMAINTACSSGLVAAHQAFQSLQTGDCDTALAAGVNLMLSPELYVGMTEAGMLSPDGKCYSFDSRANGMVPGEAVVVLVLKRLSKALADGDSIHAVIRGSGLNYDGKTNGITAPNGVSQAALFKSVYSKFRIDPEDIEYVVAHGTGTKLGDPVEINALHTAFKEFTQKKNYCAVTSTKSNFGHTFAASGLVSLVSLVQSFKNETIPASLHCEKESDYINWNDSSFYVNKKNKAWSAVPGKERLGVVSAFGMSGTNAHMVIQSYDASGTRVEDEGSLSLLTLSAKTPEALIEKVRDLLSAFETGSLNQHRITDVCYTLLAGRHHFKYRVAAIVQDQNDLVDALRKIYQKSKSPNLFHGEVQRDFKPQKSIVRYITGLSASIQKTLNNLTEYREDISALADFYCQGYEIPFEELYKKSNPKRIFLPTYPFATDRYWFNSETTEVKDIQISANDADVRQLSEPVLQRSNQKNTALLLEPYWNAMPVPVEREAYEFSKHLVVLDAQCKIQDNTFYKEFPGITISNILPAGGSIAERFDRNSSFIFELIQQFTREHPNEKALLQIVVSESESPQLPQGVSALLRTLRLEHPGIRCQVIAVDKEVLLSEQKIIETVKENISAPDDIQIRYSDGIRYILDWRPLIPAGVPGNINHIWREDGTYLITGGAGAIGLLFAREIAQKTKRTNLILTGRSPLDEAKNTQLQALSSAGCHVEYVRLDVSNKEDVENLMTKIQNNYGDLHGIIHCAGVVHDSLLLNKKIQEWNKVLAPKVYGVENLDVSSKDFPLDFFVSFSSLAGVMGNPGQADYSTANAFMDAFSEHRNSLLSQGKRSGRSLSINWPLWKESGMKVEESTVERLERLGMRLLDSSSALEAFYNAMATQDHSQVMVVYGDERQINEGLLAKKLKKTSRAGGGKRRMEMQGFSVVECLDWDLRNLVSQISKIPREKLDVYENLTDLGFDSISLTKLAASFGKHFEIEIVPALFFGYPTIEKLNGYFIEQHGQLMDQFYREQATLHEQSDPTQETDPKIIPVNPVSSNERTSPSSGKLPFDVLEPIAIIGMSGRFPEARNVEEMWDILANGKDVVSEIPLDRFDLDEYYSPTVKAGKTNCRWTGLIPGIREFDPLFFDISPKEAALMDPRQRLLLQESWNALEDAGYGTEHLKNNRIAMYVGAEESTYTSLTGADSNITSNNNAILSARLSYFLNLSGPNMAINTACSSALVAVHQACMSLRNLECDTALAAGVNLLYTPEPYVGMSQAGMLSANGKCYTFDKRANGMVPGEAVAVVVLKRLSQAQKDGDSIYATIQASGVNYDGKTNGITAPSGVSQTALLRSVYNLFQIDPEEIEYIVTHGTGTILGDPIEINALNDAFKQYTQKQSYCALTSSKTNFGHTMAASGLVSLINLVQAFRHETIPASLHCQNENDFINWKESPFYVNKANKTWVGKQGRERVGAVSSFGMSGTNVHMVLKSYTDRQTDNKIEQLPVHLLVFSAKTQQSLSEKVKEMIVAMETGNLTNTRITDIGYTLLSGRHHFRYRCALVVRDREDAIYVLNQFEKKERRPNLFFGETPYSFREQSMVKSFIYDLVRQMNINHSDRQKCQEVLTALAEFYCQGYEIPAEMLYADLNANRIHLSTYPFSRESYWVKEKAENKTEPRILKEQHSAGAFKDGVGDNANPGDPEKIIGHHGNAVRNGTRVDAASVNGTSGHDWVKKDTTLEDRIRQHLIHLVSSATNLSSDKIEVDHPIEHYGMDSIMMVQVRNILEATLGELPSGLFFDHPSINQLSVYFLREYREILNGLWTAEKADEPLSQTPVLQNLSLDHLQAVDRIKEVVSIIINLRSDKIDIERPLETYGVDSIMMVQLKNQMDNIFGELPPNVFYEYPTINELATYVLKISHTPHALSV